MGWRARLVLAPFAGLTTFVAAFALSAAVVWFIAAQLGLLGICGPVPGSPEWLFWPLLTLPPIAAALAGYAAFTSLASHVDLG